MMKKLCILVVFVIFVFALLNLNSCGNMADWMYGKYCVCMDAQYMAAFMANLMIILGALVRIGGLGLSLYLRHRLKNKK